MPSQENGSVKQMKLRLPMELYVQLEKDAAAHGEKPSTRARHILLDQLMHIELTPADIQRVKELVEKNWEAIKKGEVK